MKHKPFFSGLAAQLPEDRASNVQPSPHHQNPVLPLQSPQLVPQQTPSSSLAQVSTSSLYTSLPSSSNQLSSPHQKPTSPTQFRESMSQQAPSSLVAKASTSSFQSPPSSPKQLSGAQRKYYFSSSESEPWRDSANFL
ncbi:hypothetical protein FQR65_LT13791 [Abscondita terminalis]|nr:hypothetical protein FQR65_LT13791 [Abscondita terminalis]